MEYLKSLTKKQWLIVICVVLFFIIFSLFFFKKSVGPSLTTVELETLMRQGTAPLPVDESLTKLEVETLMDQGAPISSAPEDPKNSVSKEQKDALLKLMSMPATK